MVEVENDFEAVVERRNLFITSGEPPSTGARSFVACCRWHSVAGIAPVSAWIVADANAVSGNRVHTRTIGNCAPRVA